MCLLMLHPGRVYIDESALREGWRGNSDGAGYAFAHGGKLIVRKPFFKLREFLKAYQADVALYADSPFIIHLRYATHGGKGGDNVHPFEICGGEIVMGHNGMLCEFESPAKDESDTRFFARTVLAHRHPDQVMAPEFRDWLTGLIGHNKLAFLRADGTWSIANDKAGHWDGGAWFSNYSYRYSPRQYFSAGAGHGGACLIPAPSLPDSYPLAGKDATASSLPPELSDIPDSLRDLPTHLWEGREGEALELTIEECYRIGRDCGVEGISLLEPDELTEAQWQSYRSGVIAGRQSLGIYTDDWDGGTGKLIDPWKD